MPIVLVQHAAGSSRDLNRYLDRENVIYHFPSRYLSIVKHVLDEYGDRRFIYQRPTGARSPDAGTYFGYGFFGDPYPDSRTPDHYWIDIIDPKDLRPVPLRDPENVYYETGQARPPIWQGRSIREIGAAVYFAILGAGRAYSAAPQPALLDVQSTGIFAPGKMPRDEFRILDEVPAGTGYIPRLTELPDRNEAAALHERARDDHQSTLQQIVHSVERLGGQCWFNNNVDLFAKVGEQRFLVEVKSVTRPFVAVDRMRYGLGQLMDYSVRYRAELSGASPVLAFGNPPSRDASWISTILQESNVAFIGRSEGRIRGLNELGNQLPFAE